MTEIMCAVIRRIGVCLTASLMLSWTALAVAQVRDSRHVATLTTQLLPDRLQPGEKFSVTLRVELEAGWHVQSTTPQSEFLIPTTVTFDPSPAIRITEIAYPRAVRRRFAFTDQPLDVYEGTFSIRTEALVAQALPDTPLTLTGALQLQACDETACLAPAALPFAILLPLASAQEPLDVRGVQEPASDPPGQPVQWLERLLQSTQPLWMWFLAAFLGGLALNLTPCVYPMIPVTVAFFSGQAAGRVGSLVGLGLLYVIGMSLTYAMLGSVAAKTGALFGSWLQQPLVLIGMALLIGALTLSMFGLYELRPPRWLTQRVGQAQAGWTGALMMGLTVGLIAAPCIGPFILGLLVFASRMASAWLGFSLFFVMGLGMGLPYLLIGVFANRLSRWPKAGAWLVWSKKLLGVLLLGLGIFVAKPLMPPAMFQWGLALWLAGSGAYLGWLERSRFKGRTVWVKRLAGLVLLGGAVAFMPTRQGALASVTWHPYTPARLEHAKQEGRPVIIDVYADWCLPCVELDHVTFRHPKVVERLSGFVTLRIDATREIPPEAQELLDRYEVFGVPTVLILDGAGQERPDLRITGFVTPSELLNRLENIQSS